MRYLKLIPLLSVLCMVAALLSTGALAQQGIINTVAGGGPNNVPATSANINYPGATAWDSSGNFYVVSGNEQRIFKVSPSGTLTVLAGNGFPGYRGDGGPAPQAELNLHSWASGIAVDSAGNVYFSDTNNSRVRVVNASTGVISTYAGGGSCSSLGDGGAATSACLSTPLGLAMDTSGDLFIADYSHYVIREVDTTGTIHTVAGNGTFCVGYSGGNAPCGDGGAATSANLGYIYSLGIDSAGNVFLLDEYNEVVRLFSVGGNINTVAGNYYNYCSGTCGDGGSATASGVGFSSAYSMGADAAGNVYVGDTSNDRVREIFCADSAVPCTPPSGDTAGEILTVAGNGTFCSETSTNLCGDGGPALNAEFYYIYGGLGIDNSGDLLIPDYYNQRVREVYGTGVNAGNVATVAGNGSTTYSGNNVPATGAELNQPQGAAGDGAGNFYIADTNNCVVRKVDTSGMITLFAGTPNSCGFSGDIGPATSAQLNSPLKVALDGAGNVYIADTSNLRIRKVATDGTITTVAGNGCGGFYGDGGPATSACIYYPYGVAVDGAGNLYIDDYNNRRIRKVDTTGTITTVAGNGNCTYDGEGPATAHSLCNPSDVAVDPFGNLYIADQSNQRVRKVDTNGNMTTWAGNGSCCTTINNEIANQTSLYDPYSVATDPAGNVLISNLYQNEVALVDGQQILHFFAGEPFVYDFFGDGGPATLAAIRYGYGVGSDPNGNVFIADTNNNRIREVNAIASVNASRYNIDFGVQPVGKLSGAQVVTFSVGGPLIISGITTTGPFTEGDDCAGITSGQTCLMDIYFKPTSSGNFTGTVQVASNAFYGSPLTINLTGRGTAVMVAPASEAFGNQATFTLSKVRNVKVTNKGTTPITLGTPSASGDFLVEPPTSTGTPACGSSLAAGAFCYYGVAFKPTKPGPRTGALLINSSDGGSPQFVTLTGTGVSNGASVLPTKLAFGNQLHGSQSRVKTVKVTYNGPGTLTFGTATITGPFNFTTTLVPTPCTTATTLTSGMSCYYGVQYDAPNPPPGTPDSGVLSINDTSPAGPATQTVTLSGNSI